MIAYAPHCDDWVSGGRPSTPSYEHKRQPRAREVEAKASSSMADAADVIAGRPAPPGDKDHEENSTLGRKILSKLAPHKHKEANFDPIPENPKINTNHPKIEGYVEAGVHAGLHQTLANLSKPETMALIAQLVRAQAAVGTAAAIEEALDVVGSEKGLKLVGNLVAAQAIILTKQAMEPLGRTAARTSAMEAVTGSYGRCGAQGGGVLSL